MTKANCPSCGVELEFASKASLCAVCPYCDSLIQRQDLDLEKIDDVGILQEDSTPIQIGTKGRYKERSFEVVGRIQLSFPNGFWNEWYLSVGNNDGWLGESQGFYAFCSRVEPLAPLPSFDGLKVQDRVPLGQAVFQVTDIQKARCIGGEGELPFKFETGYEAPVVDLGSHSRQFATIDYSEEPPLLFIGEMAEFDELELTNLRELEGW